jgi:hypothetical protein
MPSLKCGRSKPLSAIAARQGFHLPAQEERLFGESIFVLRQGPNTD